MKIGIITYNIPHLKTEQLVLSLVENSQISKINLYSLPFVPRKKRNVKYNHRPDTNISVSFMDLSYYDNVEYREWDGKSKVYHNDDCVIIAGAGIIDPSLFGNVPILNVHPGVIPLVRGLDAFKWAIYNGHPLGNSLHTIDKEVDKGNLLTIKMTPIFESDTYYSLARRHYEYEINLLKNSMNYLGNFIEASFPETSSNMRMPIDKEDSMMKRFEKWKLRYCLKNSYDPTN